MAVHRVSTLARAWALACGLGGATVARAAPVHALPTQPADGGDRLCVSGNGVNLREKPSTQSKVVDKLHLGTLVMVRAVVPGGPVRISSRSDWWYQVAVLDDQGVAQEKGYLFGGTLTPACIVADLDGDEEVERAAVSVNPQGTPLVRIYEPKLGEEVVASLPVTQAAGTPLTTAIVDLIPASEAGFAMVRVRMDGDSDAAKAGGRVFYVSYQSSGPGRRGEATLALTHAASGRNGDVEWTTTARFSAEDEAARVITRVTKAGEAPQESERRFLAADASYVDVTDRK